MYYPTVLKQGYREDDGLYLESDTDEQLLLNIHCKCGLSSLQAHDAMQRCNMLHQTLLMHPFFLRLPPRPAVNQKVRIHSIAFRGPKDGSGPKLVKLFINRPSFGFSDTDSVPYAQQLVLTDKELDGEPIALKLTKVSCGEVLENGQKPQGWVVAGCQLTMGSKSSSKERGGERDGQLLLRGSYKLNIIMRYNF
jgi:hypothetical protein